MKSFDNQSTVAQSARRKLVRGAFAAPAVLTVYSGSALANASAMRCLVNQTTTPTIPAVKDATDGYLRVQLKSTGSSNGTKYWIAGADLQVYKRPSTSVYLSSTQFQEFNIQTNQVVGDPTTNPPGTPAYATKYAAVRFDASGSVKGVGLGPTGQSALAFTCWNSVALSL